MARVEYLEVHIKQVTRYCFVFFPVATFTRIGDVELLTIFGVPVYGKADHFKQILFWVISTDR